jgi:beta-mannanase
MTSVSTLASMVGKGLSLVHFATPFADCESGVCSDESFPWTPLNNIRNYGAIPFLDLESVATQNNSSYSSQLPDTLSAVINGDWDSYLESFAQSAKAWGHPFFLRFDWEMNSSWWPWSEGVNGNTPGQYVAAWRHVHDIFAREGATNVSWVWCPNVDPGNEYTSLQELYPGSAYVDWTCLDGYNTGTNPIYAPYDHWMSFDQLYRSTYDEIVNTIAPGKPMILGEVGSTEIGGSKAQWISQMLSELPSQYPDIHGVIWYDRSTDGWDWPIESSASSLAAFSSGIGNAAYVANNYGNLSSSPIPVP